jgi:hypothetical protein
MFPANRRYMALSIVFKLILAPTLLTSCGQDPSFTETAAPAPGAEDGTGDGAGSGDALGTASSTAGGSTAGGSTAGGSNGGSGGATIPFVTPPGYPAGTTKSDVLTEDGGTLSIPGVKATKVGVNFEDLSDFDLNDSVLCFTGAVKVEGAKVVSYQKQSIKADVWNNSDCGHFIHVKIVNKNGVVTQQLTYNDRVTTTAQLNFDVGSSLQVVMENFSGSSCIGPIAMDHPTRAQVAANVCRK